MPEVIEVDGGGTITINDDGTVEVVSVGVQGPVGATGPSGNSGPLSDATDVTITSIAANEILKWTGTAWVNNTLAEAGVSAVGHTHTESEITDLGSYLLLAGGTMTGAILNAVGSKTAPSLAFDGDTDTGFYWVGSDQIGLSAGDNLVVTVSDVSPNVDVDIVDAAHVGLSVMGALAQTANLTEWYRNLSTPFLAAGVRADGRVFGQNPTAADDFVTKAFADDNYSHAGLYVRLSGDEMTGPLLLANGSATSPSIGFSDDVDTGIYSNRDDAIAFTVAGTVQGFWTDNHALDPASAGLIVGSDDSGVNHIFHGDGIMRFYDSSDILYAYMGLISGSGAIVLGDTANGAGHFFGTSSGNDNDLVFLTNTLPGGGGTFGSGFLKPLNGFRPAFTGNAGAPAYQLVSSDKDTGFYSPGADQIGMTVGGNLLVTLADVTPNLQLDIIDAAHVGTAIYAAASQTANMSEWYRDLTTPLLVAGVRADGRVFGQNPTAGDDLVTLSYLEAQVEHKKNVEIQVQDASDAVTTGDGQAYFVVPDDLSGWRLMDADAALVGAQSSSGTVDVQVHNQSLGVDMLSTKITIDANEDTSYSAATPPVINTSNDDVVTGHILRIDVDAAGTGAQGLFVILQFEK